MKPYSKIYVTGLILGLLTLLIISKVNDQELGNPKVGFVVDEYAHLSNAQFVDSSYQFVIINATIGSEYKNPYAMGDYIDAKKKGLKIAFMHKYTNEFYLTQAGNFLKNVMGTKYDFPLIVSLENIPENGREKFLEDFRRFVKVIKNNSKRGVILRTREEYFKEEFINYNQYYRWVSNNIPTINYAAHTLNKYGCVEGVDGECEIVITYTDLSFLR